jgi:hypothetical protein
LIFTLQVFISDPSFNRLSKTMLPNLEFLMQKIPKHNIRKPKRKYTKLRNLRNKIRLLISKPFIKKDRTSANLLFAFIPGGQFIYACYLARQMISKGYKISILQYHTNLDQTQINTIFNDFPDLKPLVTTNPIYKTNIWFCGVMFGKILIEYFKLAKKHYNIMCTG